MTLHLNLIDLVVVIAYLLLVFVAGVWLIALVLLFSFNFTIGWLLLRSPF